MKKKYAKHWILRIRYDRLLFVVLIIIVICTLFGRRLKYLTNSASNQIAEVNRSDTVIHTDTKLKNSETAEINATYGYTIDNFEVIYQMPELPTGCEITALTMMLQFYGCDVTKMEMAESYLPSAEYAFYYDDNETKIGPDLDRFFIGEPERESGFVCGSKAIETAANNYFYDTGKDYEAAEFIGLSPDELYDFVSEGTPVFVLVTIEMEDRYQTEGWYTEEGKYVE